MQHSSIGALECDSALFILLVNTGTVDSLYWLIIRSEVSGGSYSGHYRMFSVFSLP